MSDGYKRVHESGTVKRQKRKKADEELNKLKGSMDIFVSKNNCQHSQQLTIDNTNSQEESPKSGPETKFSNFQEEVITNDILLFDNDPSNWNISPELIAHFSQNIPSQNIPSNNCSISCRDYGDVKRYIRQHYFIRKLSNGEQINREWLVYSPSTGNIYCYPCKLFWSTPVMTDRNNIFITGFSDWKNGDARIKSHETSRDHMTNIQKVAEKQSIFRIDSELIRQENQEYGYWIKVLHRVVAVIKFLSERGLAFRGRSEKFADSNDGNFMGCLELISQFDSFLDEHIIAHGNPGRGRISYLSSTICDEFIDLLAKQVLTTIVSEVKCAKYFGLSVDSTPDAAHLDQLTLILRYSLPNGSVVERFVGFLNITSHKSEDLYDTIRDALKALHINLDNCRSQSYDNASNMSGIYSGLQARILEVNPLAYFIPCSAHSLNLVGASAAACCKESISFFGVVQEVYNFLSASPQRWSLFKENMNENVQVVKTLSETRWSARADATKALALNYGSIIKTLTNFAESSICKPEAANTAKSLSKSLSQLETAIMSIVWNEILTKTNIVSKAIQSPTIEICTMIKLLESLVTHLENMRNSFYSFEDRAKKIVSSDYKQNTSRNKIRKTFSDETKTGESALTANETFRIEVFIYIIDKFKGELRRRIDVYLELGDRLNFLTDFNMNDDLFREKVKAVVTLYNTDLEIDLLDELILLRSIFVKEGNIKMVENMLQYVLKHNLNSVFPNACILFRIYLCIFSTSCEGERSFSALKRIKNYSRSTICQERMSSLALLYIESDLMNGLNVEDIIKNFARTKSRKIRI